MKCYLILDGDGLWSKRCLLYMLVVLESLFLYLQVNLPLIVDGCMQSKLVQMVKIIDLKPALLLKAILRYLGLITKILSPLKLHISVFLYPWLLFAIGLFINWILRLLFSFGDLDDEAYMEQPPGFVALGEYSGLACRLSVPIWFEIVSLSLFL